MPIRVKFADTQLGCVTLVQLATTTMWNKSEEHATEKVIITNAMTAKELYNGDAKNGVGVKCFLDKCIDGGLNRIFLNYVESMTHHGLLIINLGREASEAAFKSTLFH